MSPPRKPLKGGAIITSIHWSGNEQQMGHLPGTPSLKVVEAEFEPRQPCCRTNSLNHDFLAHLHMEFFLFQIPGGAETVPLVTRRPWVAASIPIIRVIFRMGCPVQSDATGPM